MFKGMQFLNPEKEKGEEKEKLKTCPLCSSNGIEGALCEQHVNLSKDYNWLKNYINSQETLNTKTLYLLEFAISDRVSYVINDVPVIDGRLAIEEFLQENLYERVKNKKEVRCSIYMEKMLKEILALQKARSMIVKMMI